jgi:hypothetical protein
MEESHRLSVAGGTVIDMGQNPNTIVNRFAEGVEAVEP